MLKKLFSFSTLLWILLSLVVVFFIIDSVTNEGFCSKEGVKCKTSDECCSDDCAPSGWGYKACKHSWHGTNY